MVKAILGPMLSGKSTELLRNLERGVRGKKRVCLIRPENDTRDFFSHSVGTQALYDELDIMIFTMPVSNMSSDEYEDLLGVITDRFDVVGIDECQFFENLAILIRDLITLKKDVYMSGLLATSESEMFNPIKEVLPYCDYIDKLNAVCSECGSEIGNYTYYKGGVKTSKVVIGGNETYTALCSDCYFKHLFK